MSDGGKGKVVVSQETPLVCGEISYFEFTTDVLANYDL